MRLALLPCVLLLGCAEKIIEVDHGAGREDVGADVTIDTSSEAAVEDSAASETASFDSTSSEVATDDGDTLGDGADATDACTPIAATLVPPATNLYLVLDKSQSMGPLKTSTKWAGARAGLDAFTSSAAVDGQRLAITFFPRFADATPACSSTPYATPKAGFASPPSVHDAIMAAVDAEAPDGFTSPFYPALTGAVNGAITTVTSSSLETAAVVLIVDGAPDGPAAMCGTVDPTDPDVLANVAATGLAYSPSIRTFVIGLPGVDIALANKIAAAGGTTSAILVTDSSKVAAQFADALLRARRRATRCDFPAPSFVTSATVDTAGVRIVDGATVLDVPHDETCAGANGFQLTSGGLIRLCTATCAAYRETTAPVVTARAGCL